MRVTSITLKLKVLRSGQASDTEVMYVPLITKPPGILCLGRHQITYILTLATLMMMMMSLPINSFYQLTEHLSDGDDDEDDKHGVVADYYVQVARLQFKTNKSM